MKSLSKAFLFYIFLCFLLFSAVVSIHPASADSTNDLQTQINDRNSKIAELQKEISAYQTQLANVATQAKTLQGNIKSLATTKNKLLTEIKVAQNQIAAANLEIRQLSIQISNQQKQIGENNLALAESLRIQNQAESTSVINAFLTNQKLSDFLSYIDTLNQFQTTIDGHVATLKNLTSQLQNSVNQTKEKQQELKAFQGQLSDKETLVEYDQQQKNKLLTDTKNQENSYQKILAEKQAEEDQFNKDLIQFQSQLKLVINPGSFPTAGTSVLSWPLDNVKITQFFGNTPFAQTHTAVYNGAGHNGIDLGAPIGTTIKAALSGVVDGTGNTDLTCPGASYGKWVLIRHPDGLSTLYGHLSVIKVSTGQSLDTGDTIGYSGETGYATGPHLHFTVLATQGTKIMDFPSKGCKGATYHMPVADLQAYLNPLNYLPPTM